MPLWRESITNRWGKYDKRKSDNLTGFGSP